MTEVRSGRDTFLTGASAGVLAMGADYLAHLVFAVPLLPDQAATLFLHVLPLAVFDAVLHTLTVLARPLLLVGTTLVVVLAYGVAALIAERLLPRFAMLLMAAATAVVAVAVVVLARAPGDQPVALVAEIALLVLAVPVAYAARSGPVDLEAEDPERRRLLRNLFYGALGAAVVAIGFVDVRRVITALAQQEGDRAQTELTPVSNFYVVSKNLGGDPVVDATTWRLHLPDRALTSQQLLALPAQQLEATFECISNDVGGNLISNGMWMGPRVADVLALTTVPSNAPWMLMESADGYTESFLVSDLTDHHLLATHLNGAPLTPAHGFPARFVFPGHYGMKQPKWVTRLSFSATDQPGYWENNGWNEQAVVKTMSRIDVPADGTELSAGTVRFSGIAFSGDRRISAVELSLDGGRSWRGAVLDPEFSAYAWRFWHLEAPLTAGHYSVQVRARDGEGTLQTAASAPTLPDGASGYHTIAVDLR